MTAMQTASSPALYSGPFNTLHSLGIDRGNYIAVHSNNPAAAAQYAVENMGFYLVHSPDDLLAAEQRFTDLGVKSERVERSQLWRHGPALRFASPGGQIIELVLGVLVDVPMAALVAEPQTTPA